MDSSDTHSRFSDYDDDHKWQHFPHNAFKQGHVCRNESVRVTLDIVMFITVHDFPRLMLPLHIMICSNDTIIKQTLSEFLRFTGDKLTFPGADVAVADLRGFVPVHIRTSFVFIPAW